MNKKQTLVKKFNELRNRLALVATAGVLGLTGCATPKQEQKEQDTKHINEIIHQIDEKIIQDNQIDQAQDIINDVNRLIPKLKNEGLNGIERESLKDLKKEDVNFFDTIDISSYQGDSIEDALRTSGYGYSFAFREELANYFGIEDYRGTAKQNLELLEHLRGNQLKHDTVTEDQTKKETVQDQKEVKDQNQLQNGTGSRNHEEQNKQTVIPGGTNGAGELGVNPDGTLKNDPNQGTNLVGPGINTPSGSNDKGNQPGHGSNSRPGSGSGSHSGNGSGSNHGGNNGNQNSGNTDNNNKNPNKPDNSGNGNDDKKPDPSEPPIVEHKHDLKKEISYNIKGNGTHEVVIKEYCTTCDYKKFSNEDENCTYEVIGYNDEHEDLKCPKCGDTKARDHKPVAGDPLENGDIPYTCENDGCDWTFVKHLDVEHTHKWIVVSYDENQENLKCEDPNCTETKTRRHDLDEGVLQEDGSILYSCKNEGCQYTKTETKSDECKHENWIVDSFDEDNEYLKCANSECTETKTRRHDLDEGVLQDDGSTLYSCKHEGCNYTKTETKSDECTHEKWIVDSFDEENEYLKCANSECTETKTRGHDLDEGVLQDDGSILYSCKHEGCNYTKLSHIHNLEEREEIVGTKDVCTRIVTYCTIDGKVIKIEENHNHKYRVSSEGEMLECRVCSFDPNLEDEEELINDLSSKTLSSNKLFDEDIEKTLDESEVSEENFVQEETTADKTEDTLKQTVEKALEESEASEENFAQEETDLELIFDEDNMVFENDYTVEFEETQLEQSFEFVENVELIEEEKGMARKLVLEEE